MDISYNGICRVMVPLLTIMTTAAYYTVCPKVKHCTRKEGCLSPGFTAAQIKHLSCQDIWEGTNTNFKYGKPDVLQICVNVISNKIIRTIHSFLLNVLHDEALFVFKWRKMMFWGGALQSHIAFCFSGCSFLRIIF